MILVQERVAHGVRGENVVADTIHENVDADAVLQGHVTVPRWRSGCEGGRGDEVLVTSPQQREDIIRETSLFLRN